MPGPLCKWSALAIVLNGLLLASGCGSPSTRGALAARLAARANAALGTADPNATVSAAEQTQFCGPTRAFAGISPIWKVSIAYELRAPLSPRIRGFEVFLNGAEQILAVQSVPTTHACVDEETDAAWLRSSDIRLLGLVDMAPMPLVPLLERGILSQLETDPRGRQRIDAVLMQMASRNYPRVDNAWLVRVRGCALTVCPPASIGTPSDPCSSHDTAWAFVIDADSGQASGLASAPD